MTTFFSILSFGLFVSGAGLLALALVIATKLLLGHLHWRRYLRDHPEVAESIDQQNKRFGL